MAHDVIQPPTPFLPLGCNFGVELVRQRETNFGIVRSLAFSRDGMRFAAGCSQVPARYAGFMTEITIAVWDTATGELLWRHQEEKPYYSVNSLGFSADGELLFGGGYIRDAATGKEIDWPGACSVCALSSDKRRVAYAGTYDVKLRDANYDVPRYRPQTVKNLDGLRDIYKLAFSPDCKWLCGGSRFADSWIWYADTGQPLRRLARGGGVSDFAFSNDSARIIVEGAVQETVSGQRLCRIEGGFFDFFTNNSISASTISPDGTRVVGGRANGNLDLFEAATGKPVHRLGRHPGMVTAVAFSADARYFVSGGRDGVIQLWRTEPSGYR